MKNWGASVGVVASLLLAAISRAEAQESKVRLRTDKPVYKVGSGNVTFTLKNEGTQPVEMGVAPWTIYKGSTVVRSPGIVILIALQLQPGGAKSWAWDMKDNAGKLVSAGSYTIHVGPLHIGTTSFTKSLDVAITPSGKVAGTSFFPLAVGNEWKFTAGPGANQKMKVTAHWGNSSWYRVTNLVGGDLWVQMSGSQLWSVPHPMSMAPISILFKFGEPLGTTYTTNVGGMKLKVAATNETFVTPAGTFTGCYRLDVVIPQGLVGGSGYKSFVFAPGVGLVGYGWYAMWSPANGGGSFDYRVKKLKLRGTDGKVYLIGPNS